MNNDNIREIISVDLHDRTDRNEGMIILISTESLEMLALIKNVFEEMSRGKYKKFQFQEIKNTRLSGVKALTLRLIDGDKEPWKTLERTTDFSQPPEYIWSKTSEGWEENALLVDGILNKKRLGHQYFTETNIDDAVIVIAYGKGY